MSLPSIRDKPSTWCSSGALLALLLSCLAIEGIRASDSHHRQSPEVHHDYEDIDGHGGHGGHGHGGFQVFHVDFGHVEVPFIIALWIFVSSLAKIGFHMTPKLHHIFPESCLLIVVGIIIGFLLFLTSESPPSTLTPDIFFLFMLPPIILDAGYFMPNRLFFDHLGTILLMAVVGTIWNAVTIGLSLYACGLTGIYGEDAPGILETFLFSSLVCAVDPVAVLAVFEEIHVDEILYIIVFGESLLNDAVTVVLYHLFEAFVTIGESNLQTTDILGGIASFFVVAGGGTLIGIIWGYVTGFVTRFTNHARILEPLFVFTMSYLSYLTAEIFHMSGILAITFCGITCKNYVERNISSKSQTTLKYAMKMLSGSAETIIFMFLGVATIHDDHDWNWAFVSLTILFCTVFRVIGVLIFANIANPYRLHKLKKVDQFVMMYGGLRGAVAFALALLIDKKTVPHAPMFVTTTIAMVYWTVFVQGITIKPLVKFLNVKTAAEKDPTMNERIAGRFMDHIVAGMEGILGELGYLRIRDMYKHIDAKYIKPCLLRENHFKDPKIIETYENLTNRDAVEFMKRNPTQFQGLGKSMDQLAQMTSMSSMLRSYTSSNLMTSTNNLENLDMKEMNYTQSKKDLTEAKIQHMLSENLFMPRARPRRMSYSRHSVDERDLASNHPVNYKVHMQIRRMMSENRRKRYVKKQGTSSSHRVTGSSKQLRDEMIHEIIKEEERNNVAGNSQDSDSDDGGITVTFAPTNKSPNTLDAGLYVPNGGSQVPPKGILTQRSGGGGTSPSAGRAGLAGNRSPVVSSWLIREQQKSGVANPAFEADDFDDDQVKHEPSAIESTLPWKRKEVHEICRPPVKQREFPSWINNKDYVQFGSPAATFLGDAHNAPDPPSIVSFFHRRESVQSNKSDLAAASGSPHGSRRNSEMDLSESALSRDTGSRRGSLQIHVSGHGFGHGHGHGHHHHKFGRQMSRPENVVGVPEEKDEANFTYEDETNKKSK